MSLTTILLLAFVGLMLLMRLRPGARRGGGCCGGHGAHHDVDPRERDGG